MVEPAGVEDMQVDHGIADGVHHPLDPRYVPLQRIHGAIGTVVLAGVSFVAIVSFWIASEQPWLGVFLLPAWLGLMVLAAWHFQRWPGVSYQYVSYRVDRLGIEIRRGVYWREVTTVPRSRVQHTDVSQGPLERRFGLGTLVIHTAGTANAKVTLSGLEHSVAGRIRDHLIPGDQDDAV
jgi:membrane protein YdbS with pleckstrin-like domain